MMRAADNVVILTTGLAGSSAVAALIARASLWSGDEQFKKHDYNTWENAELVAINKLLLSRAGLGDEWMTCFSADYSAKVSGGVLPEDRDRMVRFLDDCDGHAPWLWKDPRLWVTFPVWVEYLRDRPIKYVLVRRESLQSWISMQLRRKVSSYVAIKGYDDAVNEHVVRLLKDRSLSYIDVLYEDLCVHPEDTLRRINGHIGSSLTMDDLKRVFRGRLYRRQHGLLSLVKAVLINIKNSLF